MNSAVLKEVKGCHPYSKIDINSEKFTIGRGLDNSFVIPLIQLSRTHCTIVFDSENNEWTISDSSSYGTFLNGIKLKSNQSYALTDGDQIQLGPLKNRYIYQFSICNNVTDNVEPCSKKRKYEINNTSTEFSDKQLILEQKLKELENKLQEKESENEQIREKLRDTEEQHVKELSELIIKQEQEKQEILEKLQNELKEKENSIREQLESEMKNLQLEKEKLEQDIKDELAKKENESTEHIQQLEDELTKVKKDLETIGGKKQMLENQLDDIQKQKEQNNEMFLKAKTDVLNNFGDIMENELQCSICNELFITATTLNCTHTFCSYCILQWKKKKNECPICRTRIKALNRTLAVDNFIDKIVQSLTEELRTKREELIRERKTEDKKNQSAKKTKACKHKQPPRRTRIIETIELSSDDDNSDSEIDSRTGLTSPSDSDVEDEDDVEREYVPGVAGAYYGGYGFCYRCGAGGHWANGCPSRVFGQPST